MELGFSQVKPVSSQPGVEASREGRGPGCWEQPPSGTCSLLGIVHCPGVLRYHCKRPPPSRGFYPGWDDHGIMNRSVTTACGAEGPAGEVALPPGSGGWHRVGGGEGKPREEGATERGGGRKECGYSGNPRQPLWGAGCLQAGS